MSDPLVLGFDTSAAHCAAALVRGDTVLAQRHEQMARGQGERLFEMLDEVLSEIGTDWSALNKIGVGTGPGNFTGIRISVAAARGLSLSLGIPAVGVTRFDALAIGASSPVWTVVEAPRDMAYAQFLEPGTTHDPKLIPASEAALLTPCIRESATPIAVAIARLAMHAPERSARPAPLYVRPADAAPARDAPPVVLP
ncbi:MAG: tRNA (adenosine(37)-N6)-threonylcarbamoyltransferase complex dimerization subunit type 1 TsaB [Brevirhabdus sp.]